MFHSFYVNSEHRDFLRFLWFKDNNPLEEIVEYRMLVHLFGNVSSPAVATFGMRKTAEDGKKEYSLSAKEFVYNDFYIDRQGDSRTVAEHTSHVGNCPAETTQGCLKLCFCNGSTT